jgi:hypothetical protein
MRWNHRSGNFGRLALFFILLAQGTAYADERNQTIRVLSNRNDVSFYVRSGMINYVIPPTPESGTSNQRPPVEWAVYVDRLRTILHQQFGLDSDEINFAKFCGAADDGTNSRKEICRAFGTLKPGSRLDFYFCPETSPVGSTNTIITIKDSYCVIVGSNNVQKCNR